MHCGLLALFSSHTIFYLYFPSMGTVEVQTAFHAKDLSCSIKWRIPVIQVFQIKNVVLCSTNLRSLCFTWAVWKSRNCGWTWVELDMVDWSSCAPQIWNTPKWSHFKLWIARDVRDLRNIVDGHNPAPVEMDFRGINSPSSLLHSDFL